MLAVATSAFPTISLKNLKLVLVEFLWRDTSFTLHDHVSDTDKPVSTPARPESVPRWALP